METIKFVETFWADRDENGDILLYREKPIKGRHNLCCRSVPNEWFKNVTTENSPQRVEMKTTYELRIIY
jgi:hypothetical protein